MTGLPVHVVPRPREALDGYLERVARVNGLGPVELQRLLDVPSGWMVRLAIAPPHELVRRAEQLCGQPAGSLEQLTLRNLSGLDLDHAHPGDRGTWRSPSARGWSPAAGTAICPTCFNTDRTWDLTWRHPYIAACLKCRSLLVGRCPHCERPFRSQRSPISPDGDPLLCQNYFASSGDQCGQRLGEVPTKQLPDRDLAAQQRIHAAITGQAVELLGHAIEADTYLSELWATAVLLLRLVIRPNRDRLAEWAQAARNDGRTAAGRRERWRIEPPEDYALRAAALAEAARILSSRTREVAAESLRPWLELAPKGAGRQATFLALNTTPTPVLRDIVSATSSTQNTRSLLDVLLSEPGPVALDPRHIPQLLDSNTYRTLFGDALDVNPRTGRRFAALCVTRRTTAVRSWPEARALVGGEQRGVEMDVRIATNNLSWGAERILEAVDEAAAQLGREARDYRRREAVVRDLKRQPEWFTRWRLHYAPGTRTSSRWWAITWLWTEWALGAFATSPAWQTRPTAVDRAHFRAFASRLTPQARDDLVNIAIEELGAAG